MSVKIRASACATLMLFAGAQVAQAAPISSGHCATPAEISAVQVSAVQQELTDAALACGDKETALFNRVPDPVFNKELRRSDATLLSMFKRLDGYAAGNAAYDSYKTRAIAHAEQRRTVPGAAENFCRTADIVFAAALAPDKPVLEDFVAGVPVDEQSPVDMCDIKVSLTLQGVAVTPSVTPTPRPRSARRSAWQNLFP